MNHPAASVWRADEVTIFFITVGIVWFALSRIVVRGDGE